VKAWVRKRDENAFALLTQDIETVVRMEIKRFRRQALMICADELRQAAVNGRLFLAYASLSQLRRKTALPAQPAKAA